MKYIRTKDKKGKQYIISDKDYVFLIRDKKVIFARGYEEELLGQADTIEELCDEFVVITEAYRKVSSFYDCEYEIEKYKKQTKTNNPIIAIYGAIWTDKGLIYVAKMNEKGELELL